MSEKNITPPGNVPEQPVPPSDEQHSLVDNAMSELDLIEDTPEIVEMRRLFNERRDRLLPIVQEMIPPRTDKQIITTTLRASSYWLEDVPEEDRKDRVIEMAAYRKGRETIKEVASDLAHTQIPLEEMPDWIKIAYEAATKLSIPDEGVEPGRMISIMKSVDNLSELKVAGELISYWHDSLMSDVTPEQAQEYGSDAQHCLDELSGKLVFPQPAKRSEAETRELFTVFTDLYKVAYQGPVKDRGVRIFHEPVHFLQKLGLDWHTAEPVKVGISLLQEAMSLPDQKVGLAYINALSRYGYLHSLTAEQATGWQKKLLPAMQRRDPQVGIVQKGGNVSGMGKGDFGALDFIVHAYGAKVRPPQLNELLMISRDIPTSDTARLETNRRDALALAKTFGILRDFVHDQRPGVHDVLSAMTKYYETHDPSELKAVIATVDYFKNNDDYVELLLNLESYDKIISKKEDGSDAESAIDKLKRLEINTRPVEVHAPEVSDPQMRQLLQQLEANPRETKALQDALTYVNERLIAQMKSGEIGIEPNDILAISWLEQHCFKKLQGLSYEAQTDAYKQPWFAQVLLFQELTASADFDQTEFNGFMAQLSKLNSQEAYKLIASRTVGHVQALAKLYADKGWQDKIGALWSGNTAHELISLVDPHAAATRAGTRHRQERSLPARQRNTGD